MKERIKALLGQDQAPASRMAKAIWDQPELAFQETFAVNLQKQVLEEAGFRISPVGNLETAFVAEYGQEGPVIGFLGEYDGLAGLSQALAGEQAPLYPQGPGHGCGHNLLGVASLYAAKTCAQILKEENLSGRVRYYGSPAEEALIGKVLMAEAGAFDDLDAALTWHPSGGNMAQAQGTLALAGVRIRFQGKSAHAGAGPYLGRSALDAVELMNIGANFMREHILPSSRVHYIITQGGAQVNSVPDTAEVLYNLRAESTQVLLANTAWLLDIARGASLMTQTDIAAIDITSGVHDTCHNPVLTMLLEEWGKEMGGPVYDQEARSLAAKLKASLSPEEVLQGLDATFLPHDLAGQDLHEGWASCGSFQDLQSGSTDVGDVSKLVPLGQVLMAAWPPGVIPHTWQATASSGSSIGMAAMMAAARVLAGAGWTLLTNKEVLEDAKTAYHAADFKKEDYRSVFSQLKALL